MGSAEFILVAHKSNLLYISFRRNRRFIMKLFSLSNILCCSTLTLYWDSLVLLILWKWNLMQMSIHLLLPHSCHLFNSEVLWTLEVAYNYLYMANKIPTHVKCKGSHIQLVQSSSFFFFLLLYDSFFTC